MRFLVCVMALGVLGCCFGPSVEAPPSPAAAPAAPSPLSQALEGLVAPTDPAAAPAAGTPPAPDATAAPSASSLPDAAAPGMASVPPGAMATTAPGYGAPPSTTAAAPTTPSSPACAEATAARDAVRARLAELRLSLGAETSARLEAAGQAMIACDADPACVRDGKARLARIEAYDRAKAAHEAERTRLAREEVGLYDADRAVLAACGAP
ncbi:MAG: hypothetical protein ACK4YP_15710 [Myxococcota bacterium]